MHYYYRTRLAANIKNLVGTIIQSIDICSICIYFLINFIKKNICSLETTKIFYCSSMDILVEVDLRIGGDYNMQASNCLQARHEINPLKWSISW